MTIARPLHLVVEDETQALLAAVTGRDDLADAVGVDLDPVIDPYRCPDCLAVGDHCTWHRRLSVAVDLAHMLDLDPQDVT